MTFPTGRITGLQSADCIEMIEIQTGGGKIETRVRESCCTVARVYSSYESDAARLRSAPYTAVLIRMGPTLKEEEEKERLVVQGTIGTSKDIWGWQVVGEEAVCHARRVHRLDDEADPTLVCDLREPPIISGRDAAPVRRPAWREMASHRGLLHRAAHTQRRSEVHQPAQLPLAIEVVVQEV